MPAYPHLDGPTQGLLVYTALALLGGRILGMKPLPIALLAGVGWVPYLLVKDPYVGGTVGALLATVAFKRYGWRHILFTGGIVVAFVGILLGQVMAGASPGRAVVVAVHDTTWLVLKIAALLWVYQLSRRGIDYLFGYGWVQERRRLERTEEHQKLMGYGKRGLGWAKGKARQAITRRPGPEPKTVEGRPPRELPSGRSRRGRFTGGTAAAHHAPPSTAGDYGIPEPLFKPAPWWRRR